MTDQHTGGIWEKQYVEKRVKLIRQLKIRVVTVLLFVCLDFTATYITSMWFVRAVGDEDPYWWTFLTFLGTAILLTWLRRDTMRFLYLYKTLRESRAA